MKARDKYLRKFLVLFLAVALFSCGSSDDKEPDKKDPEPTKQELIVKDWKMSSVTNNGQPLTSTEFRIKFLSDGAIDFNTPGIPGLPNAGTWKLNSNGTSVILNEEIELKINLASNKFTLEYAYTNHKMGTVIVIFTMD